MPTNAQAIIARFRQKDNPILACIRPLPWLHEMKLMTDSQRTAFAICIVYAFPRAIFCHVLCVWRSTLVEHVPDDQLSADFLAGVAKHDLFTY